MQANQDSINNACINIYSEARAFFRTHNILSDRCGFEILMGPPFVNPDVLFVGYQPGGWKLSVTQARDAGYEHGWVTTESQYATEMWRLAVKLRNIFSGNSSILDRSVGLNAIYVRATNVDEYTKQNTAENRRLIKDFCTEKNIEIIDLIKPKKIVFIGFMAMEVFTRISKPDILGNDKRSLTKMFYVKGIEFLAV
jgi:hypothetical protein